MADLSNLMQQAQKLQAEMERAQKELEQLKVTGTAGGDLAACIMNGRYRVVKLKITDELLKESKEIIEDTVAAAINDAVRKVERESRTKMSKLASGLNLPGGLGDMAGDGDDDK